MRPYTTFALLAENKLPQAPVFSTSKLPCPPQLAMAVSHQHPTVFLTCGDCCSPGLLDRRLETVNPISNQLKLTKEKYTMEMLKNFFVEEDGQDLIEYSLLLAFVCLASAALFTNVGTSLSGIWTKANALASNANTAAS